MGTDIVTTEQSLIERLTAMTRGEAAALTDDDLTNLRYYCARAATTSRILKQRSDEAADRRGHWWWIARRAGIPISVLAMDAVTHESAVSRAVRLWSLRHGFKRRKDKILVTDFAARNPSTPV